MTVELLEVSGGLAAFSGLYYAIAVLTDSVYREEFLEELETTMRDTFRARGVPRLRAALSATPCEAGRTPGRATVGEGGGAGRRSARAQRAADVVTGRSCEDRATARGRARPRGSLVRSARRRGGRAQRSRLVAINATVPR